MANDDRLRAKPPAADVEGWSRGTVRNVAHGHGRVTVTVVPDAAEREGSGSVELSVTGAIYDLFTGRLDPGDRVDGDVTPGTTVWYRKTGQ